LGEKWSGGVCKDLMEARFKARLDKIKQNKKSKKILDLLYLLIFNVRIDGKDREG
jgi:hypothetical protein